MWLAGMTTAAGDHGVEVQYCMALAHQILESVEFSAVTNARVNGDGGLDVGGLTMPALLAATVGLGWSKDNLRTADRCYVPGLYPNGTVKWPCGSINHAEGTSGQFKMQVQQTMLAALSLGPVGISDQLTARPTDPTADITSNISLVMATCAATGDLLQPSYPLTPLDRTLAGDLAASSPGVSLWGTYTAVPGVMTSARQPSVGQQPATNLFYTAMAFCIACKLPHTGAKSVAHVVVYESDLAPMVDQQALPAPLFDAIPTGAFVGPGTDFPGGGAHVTAHVVWVNDFLSNGDGCGLGQSGVTVVPWGGAFNTSLGVDGGALVNVAPVYGGRYALLGEASKVTAVSTYRFTSVALSNDTPQAGVSLAVGMRGKPGERVVVLFAVAATESGAGVRGGSGAGPSYACKSVSSTIGTDGTATIDFTS